MQHHLRRKLTLAISVALGCQGVVAAPLSPASSQARSAYVAADSGYRRFAQGDFPGAERDARKAVQLAPRQVSYWKLLVQALLAGGLPDSAARALDEAERATGHEAALTPLRQAVTSAQAQAAGAALIAASSRGDVDAAVTVGVRAVQLQPGNLPYYLMLVHALLRAGRAQQATQFASEALQIAPSDSTALALRSWALQMQGQLEAAQADVDGALAHVAVQTAAARQLRLVAVDAALAAGQADRALTLLAPLGEAGDEVANRRDWAHQLLAAPTPFQAQVPTIDCAQAVSTRSCALQAGATPALPGFAYAASGYAALERKEYQPALSDARLAISASPAQQDWQMLHLQAAVAAGAFGEAEQTATSILAMHAEPDAAILARRSWIRTQTGDVQGSARDAEAAIASGQLPPMAQAALLLEQGRVQPAREKLTLAAAAPLSQRERIELAYLYVKAGDDESAVQAFRQADAQGGLPLTALLDAGYTAVRAFRDAEATAYFDRAVTTTTPQQTGSPALTPAQSAQRLHELKRFSGEVSRTWGVLASLVSRHGAGVEPGFGVVGARGNEQTLQTGVEGYWRPWGYRNGAYTELFARGFGTLDGPAGVWTGKDSFQGGVGARWKPFSSTNLVLSVSRVFGPNVNDSWLAQEAWSLDKGSELRLDVPHWWTLHVYGEAGQYFGNGRHDNYALGSVLAGRSFRMDADPNLVVLPHVFLGVEHASNDPSARTASSVGVGVIGRRWFRGDETRGPRSYAEITMQYRHRLSGDERMSGPYLSALVSF